MLVQHLFHPRYIQRTSIKAHLAVELYLHYWLRIYCLIVSSLSPTVIFQARIDSIWLVEAIDAQIIPHKGAAFALDMLGMMHTFMLRDIDNTLRLLSINLDVIVSTILPLRLLHATGLG